MTSMNIRFFAKNIRLMTSLNDDDHDDDVLENIIFSKRKSLAFLWRLGALYWPSYII